MADVMNYLVPILTVFSMSMIAIFVFKPLARNLGLVDSPNDRKKHKGDIPLVGGIAVFFSFFISLMFFETSAVCFYLLASFIIVVMGALDDKYDLSVKVRVFCQVVAASILIFGESAKITDLGDLFGFGNIELGLIGIPFTYFAILVSINAFNMIDGIDGLLGSLSINTFLSLALLFYTNGELSYFIFPLLIAVSLIPYLVFNLSFVVGKNRKIFMGDAGSMFIGLSVVWLLLVGSQGQSRSFSPVTALWVAALPLMDMLAIVIRRIRKGQSPLKPDREHLHHICLRMGLTDKQSLVVITFISLLLSMIGIVGDVYDVPEFFMLIGFVSTFLLYNYILTHVWKFSKFIRSFTN